jgi:hypothetical protein
MADLTTVSVVNHDAVAHGYLLEGSVRSVTAVVNGSAESLQGAALSAFANNSSWQVRLPNGNVTVFGSTGTFEVPSGEYSAVGSGATGTFTVNYTNPEQASVSVQLTVLELCSDGASPTQSVSVAMQ